MFVTTSDVNIKFFQNADIESEDPVKIWISVGRCDEREGKGRGVSLSPSHAQIR